MAAIHLGNVDRDVLALALARLREALVHEITAGRARQQPIRSPEYERVLAWIDGGAHDGEDFGKGLLERIGTPMDLRPRWEPLVIEPKRETQDQQDPQDPLPPPVQATAAV